MSLDGEAEYKQALSSIGAGLRVLKSEMQMTTAEFASNATSVEALTAKNDVLDRQILSQKEKIETLQGALQNSATLYGESDKRTMDWQKSLYSAQAELSRMETALKANNDAIKEAGSGEEQYKEALNAVNEDLKTLSAEMNKTTAEFGSNASSVDALKAKNEVLTRQFETQQKKVETLRAALKNSAEQYGETDSKTKAWQQSLYNAEAELAKMDQALKDNNETLDKVEKNLDQVKDKYVGLGDSIESVADKLGVKLPSGATKALNSLGSVNTGMVAAAGGAAALVAALVKVETTLVNMTKESAAYSGELHDLADVTGMTMEQLQEYDYAAELAGTTLDTMTNAQTKLIKSMQSAADAASKQSSETNKQADAFQRLGVTIKYSDGEFLTTTGVLDQVLSGLRGVTNETERSALSVELLGKTYDELTDLMFDGFSTTLDTVEKKLISSMTAATETTEAVEEQANAFEQLGVAYEDANGELRDTEEVFWDVVTALGGVDNATQADSLAMELLGKSARDLNPLIKTGKEQFEAYTKEAKEMGLVLEDDALDALDKVDDAMLRLTKTTDSAKNELSAQFAPSLEKATDKATEFIKDTSQSLKDTGIVENFGTLLESASGLLEPMADLIDLLGPAAAKAMEGTAKVFALIADTLDFIVGVLTLDGDKVSTALGLTASSGKLSHQQQIKYGNSSSVWDEETQSWVGNYYYGSNASGDDNWRGGWTYINEAGPELALLPKGTQIYSAQETRLMGGDTYNITIDAASVQEFNDIIEIVKNQKRLVRMGVG